MRLGLLVVLTGLAFLVKNRGLITGLQWDIIWPILVIYIGIAMVTRTRCWHCKTWHNNGMKTDDEDCCTPKKRAK